jgi:hypothetical protein
MVNTHRKGSTWRRRVQDWFDQFGCRTYARQLGEAGDDITVWHESFELSVEAKNHKSITLAAFLDQCESNADDHEMPVLFIKRRGKVRVDDCYVVMSGATYRRHLLGMRR